MGCLARPRLAFYYLAVWAVAYTMPRLRVPVLYQLPLPRPRCMNTLYSILLTVTPTSAVSIQHYLRLVIILIITLK